MALDARTLMNLILRADPRQAAKRFKTGGTCGNEGVFRLCHVLQSAGIRWTEANPYLLAWYNHWQNVLEEDNGGILDFEDIEVMAEESWNKVKYTGNQLKLAEARAHEKIDLNQSIPFLNGYGGEPARLLALTCYELSQMNTPFFLGERDAAEIMGLDREGGRRRARTTLKVFCKKRILSIAKKGNQALSTRFVFTGYSPQSVPESQKNPEIAEDTG